MLERLVTSKTVKIKMMLVGTVMTVGCSGTS